ncbi:hypothetical protein ACVGWS_00070, partial [Enterobacter hormaechei]
LLSDVCGCGDGQGPRIGDMTAAKAVLLSDERIISEGMIGQVTGALYAGRTLVRPVDIPSRLHAEQIPSIYTGTPIVTQILAYDSVPDGASLIRPT